jgi:hypothetical protein
MLINLLTFSHEELELLRALYDCAVALDRDGETTGPDYFWERVSSEECVKRVVEGLKAQNGQACIELNKTSPSKKLSDIIICTKQDDVALCIVLVVAYLAYTPISQEALVKIMGLKWFKRLYELASRVERAEHTVKLGPMIGSPDNNYVYELIGTSCVLEASNNSSSGPVAVLSVKYRKRCGRNASSGDRREMEGEEREGIARIRLG